MKTFLKMIAFLAVAAGILALVTALFCKGKSEPVHYITLYGGPEDARE